MTLGKKIGGGFTIILLLTMIVGIISYKAMDDGTENFESIATDRVPRLVAYGNVQSELLQAVYFSRTYFFTRDEKDFNSAMDYFGKLREEVNSLKAINQATFYPTTGEFLNLFEKEVTQYEEMLQKGKTVSGNVQTAIMDLMSKGTQTKAKLLELINTLGQMQKSYMESGNLSNALQYSSNLTESARVMSRISGIMESLLIAERNNNMVEFNRLRDSLPDMTKEFQSIYPNLLSTECRDLFNEAMASFKVFVEDTSLIIQLLGEAAEGSKARIAHYHNMLEQTEKIASTTEDNTKQVISSSQQAFATSTTFVVILLIALLVIGIIIAVIITRMIVKPLTTTQKFAESVAGGDLNRELTHHSSDELGRLADALRTMVGSLKTNIAEAQSQSAQAQKATAEAQEAMAKAEEAARKAESAKREGMLAAANQLEGMVEIISSASTELSAQIEQSDRGASESAQRLQEAATAMNQMNATVQEVARNAGSASAASAETKQKAEAGEHVVRDVVQSIGDVQTVSLQLKEDMSQLNERAQDINRIMGVISDIADQTNLLALNAAIEAARAGEAGRGFAVVADEVRKLAEKTMTSTLDVSNAIRAIQESTDKSMSAVDNAVQLIGQATNLANQSGAALEEIVATVEATSDQVHAIAAASEEQSAASEEINRSIIEVNDMSRMTADAMSEANQAVSDLATQAHKLTDLITHMKNA